MRAVRSPLTPKMTIAQGAGMRSSGPERSGLWTAGSAAQASNAGDQSSLGWASVSIVSTPSLVATSVVGWEGGVLVLVSVIGASPDQGGNCRRSART